MAMTLSNPDLAPIAQGDDARELVPIIDLGGAEGMHDPATIARVAQEIGDACRDWGFFQVVNHGVDTAHITAVWDAVVAFFALSRTVKRSLNRSQDNPWGYFDRELTKNQRDKKEIFDIGADTDDDPISDAPFSGSTPWPETQPEFQTALRAHFKTCEALSRTILEAICVGLNMPKERLDQCFAPNHTSFLRLNYYSVDDPLSDLSGADHGAADLGIHHHSDAGAVTVLLQDNVGGLQVFKDGFWHNVQPVDGAFVINIGDMVQVWSNDTYRAALHRVVAMDTIERYSIPFFFNPAYDALVEPLEASRGPTRYNAINWGEFRRRRADGDYANVGQEVQISDYATNS